MNLSNCRHHGTGLDHPIIRELRSATKTEDLLHLPVLTVELPWLTARSAATIEPTIQELIIKVRAIKNTPTSNSPMLSSIRTSLRL
jgi:hypothetical protein